MTDSTVELVPPARINAVWTQVAPLIERSLLAGQEEMDAQQIRLMLVQGVQELLVLRDGNSIRGAMVVEFANMPNLRVGIVIAVCGRGFVDREDLWERVKRWMRDERGCQEVRGYCPESVARLWRRVGMEEIYRVVRAKL